jgi:hypothetical protein
MITDHIRLDELVDRGLEGLLHHSDRRQDPRRPLHPRRLTGTARSVKLTGGRSLRNACWKIRDRSADVRDRATRRSGGRRGDRRRSHTAETAGKPSQ